MRANEHAGLATLAVAAAVAATLGWHGLKHPGPILAASGTGSLGVAQTAAAGSASGSGASAKAASGSGSTSSGGSTSSAGSPGSSGGSSSGSGSGSSSQSTLHATTTLLSQTAYAPYAVPFYPTRAASATTAADGFTIKIAPGGSGSQHLQVFFAGTTQAALDEVIANSDKVYFIEGSMGDDGPGIDTNGGDDGLVVTNAKGYIMQ